jgi:hypothetical protein
VFSKVTQDVRNRAPTIHTFLVQDLLIFLWLPSGCQCQGSVRRGEWPVSGDRSCLALHRSNTRYEAGWTRVRPACLASELWQVGGTGLPALLHTQLSADPALRLVLACGPPCRRRLHRGVGMGCWGDTDLTRGSGLMGTNSPAPPSRQHSMGKGLGLRGLALTLTSGFLSDVTPKRNAVEKGLTKASGL